MTMRHWFLMAVCIAASFGSLTAAELTDAELLKQVPASERALRDQVDHWGLPFSEQLRRFVAARDAWRKTLGPQAPQNFWVGIQHGLEKVPSNKYWFKGRPGNSASLDAARNEYESFQVAVIPDFGKTCNTVTLTASGDLEREAGHGCIARDQITIYRVAYVKTRPVPYPTLYCGPWPDPLLPNGPMKITGSDLGLFWVEVHVPRDASPGRYRGRLSLTVDGTSTLIEVSLRVRAFSLPDRVPFPVTAWVMPKGPSGEAMSAADYRAMLGELLAHGVDPISVGKDFVRLDSNDFRTLDENLEYCLARGLQTFEIPNGGPKPERIKPLVEHLRQKGWLSKAIVYSNQDEPSESQLHERNIPYRRRIQTLYPDLRVYLASQYFPDIADACDIWMTDVSTGRGAAFAATNHGSASLWFYFCHMPLHADYVRPLVQAPNMEIDNEAIEHRLTLWLAWKYQTTGMFIYAGNHEWFAEGVDRSDWQTKGWTLADKPYPFPLAGVHNGNGYLVYPGPTPSVRLKALRDGLEDFGYFMELKRRADATTDATLKREADALLAVSSEVLTDAHYFNRDPLRLLDVRRRMATLIERLEK
ncbi:MAG: DUF4091 domain-containing protein [Planctomycetaceae bacterium]|nr:DUF4091 domain-containing protein [Planctomycetaceae bacterium]